MSVAKPSSLLPVATDEVPWEEFGRGARFGVRYRHLTRYVVIGEHSPHEACVYPDSNKVSSRWLGERYDRAARREYRDGAE